VGGQLNGSLEPNDQSERQYVGYHDLNRKDDFTVKRISIGIAFLVTLLVAACAGSDASVSEPRAVPTVLVPVTVAAQAGESLQVEQPPADRAQLSYEAATLTNEDAGFALDYPADWVFGHEEIGSRGRVVQLDAPDGTQLSVGVFLWDPKHDLDGYVDVRRQGWASSGRPIISEEEVPVTGGDRALRIVVQNLEGGQSFFYFTTIGEDYLQVIGSGDLDLLAEISGTVRLLE
jgi:hypothetical protein